MTTRPKSKTPKPLSHGPRTGVLKNRATLTKHVSQFAKGRDAELLRQAVVSTAKEYDDLAARRVKTPTHGRGAPPKDEIVVLVGFLAGAFLLRTGTRVSRNYADQALSPFEAFAAPILLDLGISNASDWIKKHIQQREKLAGEVGLKKLK